MNPKTKPEIMKPITQHMITQYMTKRVAGHEQKVATFIGAIDSDKIIRMGWSRANINKGDKFDKKIGLRIATNRLYAKEIIPVPPSLTKEADAFRARCRRYFKGSKGQLIFP